MSPLWYLAVCQHIGKAYVNAHAPLPHTLAGRDMNGHATVAYQATAWMNGHWSRSSAQGGHSFNPAIYPTPEGSIHNQAHFNQLLLQYRIEYYHV